MAVSFNIPSSPDVYRARYEHFKGVDFKSDPLSVADYRFPEAENLTLDMNGYPEKRVGFRKIVSLSGTVHNMVFGIIDGTELVLIHAEESIGAYSNDGAFTCFCNAEVRAKSAVLFNGNNEMFAFGITDSNEPFTLVLRRENGAFSFADAKDSAYVPTVIRARRNNSLDGGAIDAANLLSPFRRMTFSLTEEDLQYTSDTTEFRLSYNRPVALNLGYKASELKLDVWKEYAVRYYYTGSAAGDSTVKEEWM